MEIPVNREKGTVQINYNLKKIRRHCAHERQVGPIKKGTSELIQCSWKLEMTVKIENSMIR